MVVGRVVGHECLQMKDRGINSVSRSSPPPIFLFLILLGYFRNAVLQIILYTVVVQAEFCD